MTTFDYGADTGTDKENFKMWPTKGEMTALVDADFLPYIVGFTTDEVDYTSALQEVLGREEYIPGKLTDEQYQRLLKTSGFRNALDQLNWLVNDWVIRAGCDSAKLYITDGVNYRNDIAFTTKYKDRSKPKPPFFYELKRYLIEEHKAIVATTNEADDRMSIEQWGGHRELEAQGARIGSSQAKQFSGTCIVSKDKDLRMVPGWHFNPDTNEREWCTLLGKLEPQYKDKEIKKYEEWPMVKGNAVSPDSLSSGIEPDRYSSGKKKGEIKTKRVQTGTAVTQVIKKLGGSGLKFFYAQLLMGDSSDTYPGIPGVGAVRVLDSLDSITSEEELYRIVLAMYKEKYGLSTFLDTNYRGGTATISAYQKMLEQGRLAWMQTYKGEIWRSKHYCPSGVDPIWQQG